MSAPQKLRTAAVLLAGVVISMVGSVVLDGLMQPRDFAPALARVLAAADAHTPAPPEALQRVQRAARITVYVVEPMAGLMVGVFVGLFQKKRAITVAVIASMPEFLTSLTPVHIGNWPHSAKGAAHYLIASGAVPYLIERSLPFMTATVGVVLTRQLGPSRSSDE